MSRASLLEKTTVQQTIEGDEGATGHVGNAFQMAGTSRMKGEISWQVWGTAPRLLQLKQGENEEE